MIDLRTSADGNLSQGYNYSNHSVNTLGMDNDWYYKWLLFSHLQHQDWQQNLASVNAAAQKMTLVTADCVCGLCETVGQNVKQSPGTVTRILQALNLSKLPVALSKPELSEKIGLCNKCERQIKLLEEAASIRENLKESLFSNLKHLTTAATDEYPSNLGFPFNGSTPECFPFNGSTPECFPFPYSLQRTNEITPSQHSIKRKISSIVNWSSDGDVANRKQRKTQHTTTNVSNAAPNGNSSDEENALTINELASVSPHSSIGSYTPSISPRPNNGKLLSPSMDAVQQVLTELTCGRNRRKQARPAKAAGEVVPAMPHQKALPQYSPYISLRTPSPALVSQNNSERSRTPTTNPSSRVPTPQSEMFGAPAAHTQAPVSAEDFTAKLTVQETILSPSSSSPSPASAVSAHAVTTHAPITSAAALNCALPFSYPSLYHNNMSLLNSQSVIQSPASSNTAAAASAMLLAQSFYNAASKSPAALLAINNPVMFGTNMHGVANKGLAFNKSTINPRSKQSNSKLLLSAKKEPKVPIFSYAKHSTSQLAMPSTSAGLLAKTADSHTLVKTEKRRYCKVCASSARKANNGRPPQSRFLCLVCNMPMCRSCIEEHRYRVMIKVEDDKADNKSSASAKLLQAVKMKDKASNSTMNSKGSHSASNKATTPNSSAPPSHSSLIYGTMSTTMPPTTPSAPAVSVSSAAVTLLSQSTTTRVNTDLAQPTNIYAALLPNLPLLTQHSLSANMRLPSYQHIAPAPPKSPNSSSSESPTKTASSVTNGIHNSNKDNTIQEQEGRTELGESKDEESDDDDDEEVPLVISELCDNELRDNESESPVSVPNGNLQPQSATSNLDVAVDQTAITAEVASKTVAMLLAIDDDSTLTVDHSKDLNNLQSFQSSTPVIPTTTPSNGGHCAPISDNKCTIPTIPSSSSHSHQVIYDCVAAKSNTIDFI